ncbi:MAG: DUF928 domain-containing protein [Potamolinea sp.]
MTKQKSFFIPLTLLGAALSIELVIVPGFSTKILAQSELANSSQSIPSSLFAGVTFEPPRDGKPDDTAGGASRGNGCPQEIINIGGCITPLMPATNNGLTVSERPTFLLYIPETSAKEIFFSLSDENNNTHYQTKIPITGKAGIVNFQLPNNAPSLLIGKNYKWTFVLIDSQGLRPDSPGVQGKIRRVEPNPVMLSQLQNKTLLERAALYGKNGIWFETLQSLAEARKSQPSDANLATTWQELLKSAGLQAIATKPILN